VAIDRAPSRRPSPRGRLAAALVVAAWLVAAGAAPQVEQASEKELMATWIWRIARYTTWPEPTFAAKDSPFVVGILGDDPFGRTIDDAVKTRKVDGRSIVVRRIKMPTASERGPDRLRRVRDEVRRCHVLFVCRSERRELDEIIGLCKTCPVLTVSDIRDFARDGGMVEFRIIRNELGFDINRRSCERAKLRISARVLDLARNLYPKP
jgi:hypothetical protein